MLRKTAFGANLLCFLFLLTAACLDTAYSQDASSKRERADWEWIRKEGTAMMVLEPSILRGVSRWTLESPRHRGAILCMAASPDGARVATGGVDGVVRIWNLTTGTLEKAFAGHTFIYIQWLGRPTVPCSPRMLGAMRI